MNSKLILKSKLIKRLVKIKTNSVSFSSLETSKHRLSLLRVHALLLNKKDELKEEPSRAEEYQLALDQVDLEDIELEKWYDMLLRETTLNEEVFVGIFVDGKNEYEAMELDVE